MESSPARRGVCGEDAGSRTRTPTSARGAADAGLAGDNAEMSCWCGGPAVGRRARDCRLFARDRRGRSERVHHVDMREAALAEPPTRREIAGADRGCCTVSDRSRYADVAGTRNCRIEGPAAPRPGRAGGQRLRRPARSHRQDQPHEFASAPTATKQAHRHGSPPARHVAISGRVELRVGGLAARGACLDRSAPTRWSSAFPPRPAACRTEAVVRRAPLAGVGPDQHHDRHVGTLARSVAMQLLFQR